MTTENNTPSWRNQDNETNEAYNHIMQALAILMHKSLADKTADQLAIEQAWADAIYRVQRWASAANAHPNIAQMAEAYPAKQYAELFKEELEESSDWELW